MELGLREEGEKPSHWPKMLVKKPADSKEFQGWRHWGDPAQLDQKISDLRVGIHQWWWQQKFLVAKMGNCHWEESFMPANTWETTTTLLNVQTGHWLLSTGLWSHAMTTFYFTSYRWIAWLKIQHSVYLQHTFFTGKDFLRKWTQPWIWLRGWVCAVLGGATPGAVAGGRGQWVQFMSGAEQWKAVTER